MKALPDAPHGSRNIALHLRYLGSGFHGWQMQKTERTVEQSVKNILERTVGHRVTLHGCGRTDAGVHALTYVASARLSTTIPLSRLPLAVRPFLPPDVTLIEAAAVPDDFGAIRCCRKKQYSYRVENRMYDPLLHDRAYFYPAALDRAAIEAACRLLEGTHDFAAFRTQGTDIKNTVRTLYNCRMESRGDRLAFHFAANGFLYNMARALTGTLLYVGIGKFAPDDMTRLLEGKNRTAAGPTAPPQGLYMTGVWYDEGLLPWPPDALRGGCFPEL